MFLRMTHEDGPSFTMELDHTSLKAAQLESVGNVYSGPTSPTDPTLIYRKVVRVERILASEMAPRWTFPPPRNGISVRLTHDDGLVLCQRFRHASSLVDITNTYLGLDCGGVDLPAGKSRRIIKIEQIEHSEFEFICSKKSAPRLRAKPSAETTHIRVDMIPGSSINLHLTNGVVLNLECTRDTIDLVLPDGRVIYAAYNNLGEWKQHTPTPEK